MYRETLWHFESKEHLSS